LGEAEEEVVGMVGEVEVVVLEEEEEETTRRNGRRSQGSADLGALRKGELSPSSKSEQNDPTRNFFTPRLVIFSGACSSWTGRCTMTSVGQSSDDTREEEREFEHFMRADSESRSTVISEA
jgi:hypothetical protein